MQKTMRAAIARAFRKPLAIEEIPVPEPGLGEVLIKGRCLIWPPKGTTRADPNVR